MLERWSVIAPPERIHVVTVPPSGTPPEVLLERFCSVIGVDPAALDREVPRANESLGQVQAELLDSQIEVETRVCRTLVDVRAELTRLRCGLVDAAQAGGRRILASGTHPFSTWQDQGVTPKPRYEQLARIRRSSSAWPT